MPMPGYACEFTIHTPDPQQCGQLANVMHNGEPLCIQHYEFTVWAENHQDD